MTFQAVTRSKRVALNTTQPGEPAPWPPGARLSVGGRALIVMSNGAGGATAH
jgi:hypothetical protein